MSTATTTTSTLVMAPSEKEKVVEGLKKYLEEHNKSREEAQDKLHNFCETRRKQANESENKEIENIENKFAKEVGPLQSILERCPSDNETLKKLEECEESRRASQEKIEEKYETQRRQVDGLENEINSELEVKF